MLLGQSIPEISANLGHARHEHRNLNTSKFSIKEETSIDVIISKPWSDQLTEYHQEIAARMNTFSQCFCFATHGVAYIWETVHIIRGKLHRYFPYKIISLGFYILVIGSLLLSLNCYIGSLSKPGRRQHAAIITS